jgi:hypothetical protein
MDSKTGLLVKEGTLSFRVWAEKHDPRVSAYSPDYSLLGKQIGAGLGEVSIPNDANYIRAFVAFGSTVWGLVSCDTKGRPHTLPVYSVSAILESGIVAPNLCSNKRTTAKPGEFVLFVRHMTFWEKMQV